MLYLNVLQIIAPLLMFSSKWTKAYQVIIAGRFIMGFHGGKPMKSFHRHFIATTWLFQHLECPFVHIKTTRLPVQWFCRYPSHRLMLALASLRILAVSHHVIDSSVGLAFSA